MHKRDLPLDCDAGVYFALKIEDIRVGQND
jgi:hypothetical protein